MKFTLKLILILMVLLATASCKQIDQNAGDSDQQTSSNTNVTAKPIKHYGLLFNERDSISVDLNLNDYTTHQELLDRVKQINCSDRIPKVTIEEETEVRKVYFISNCEVPDMKVRNIIEIYNGKLNTYYDNNSYPLDSLKTFIQKNISNYGKDDKLSSSPDKLVFAISHSKEENPSQIKNILLKLTQAFDEVGGKNVLRIILSQPMEVAPPPPPPAPIALEIIYDDESEIVETVISDQETDEDDDIVEIEEFDYSTSKENAANDFNYLTAYMALESTSNSNFYLKETNDGKYIIAITAKIYDYIENGVNNGTAIIKATVPLDGVDYVDIEGDLIRLTSDDDNVYIVSSFDGKEESHYTFEIEIQIKNKSKRDSAYKALKTLTK